MIDNIKYLYDQIEDKTEFIKEVAKDRKKRPLTIRNHWFGQFLAIPEEHQERVIELLQNKIKIQIK